MKNDHCQQHYNLVIKSLYATCRNVVVRAHWDDDIYIVISAVKDSKVGYKIRPEKEPNGKTRVFHRNMLLPCSDLLDNFEWELRDHRPCQERKQQNNFEKKLKQAVSQKSKNRSIETFEIDEDKDEDDSENDENILAFTPSQFRTLKSSTKKQ